MKIKNRIDIVTIKIKALELFKRGQLPYKLVSYIQSLNKDSDKEFVTVLLGMTEHYLRVAGYYNRHKDIEKEYNELIERDVNQFLKTE